MSGTHTHFDTGHAFDTSAMMLSADQSVAQGFMTIPPPSPWETTVASGAMIYDDLTTVALNIQGPEKELFEYAAEEYTRDNTVPGFKVTQQMHDSLGFEQELHVYHKASNVSHYFKLSEIHPK